MTPQDKQRPAQCHGPCCNPIGEREAAEARANRVPRRSPPPCWDNVVKGSLLFACGMLLGIILALAA